MLPASPITLMVRSASYQKPKAGPSFVHLTGIEPGVLDETQRSRLLRRQNSTLSFAAFDPYVATPQDPAADISKLSLNDDRCRPKRIVIENVPGHGSFWRWVPSARKQEGVDDEGSFPRLIDICGQLCICSQEQWDIYKLDPLYDCYVKFPPALTVIVRKGSVPFTTPLPQMGVSAQGSLHDIIDEDTDSERMMVDDEGTKPPRSRFRKRKPSPREPLSFDFSQAPPSPPPEPKSKRRARVSFQSLRSAEEEENDYFAEDHQYRNTKLYEPRNQKRARTTSPDFGKRAVNAHRKKHETMKRARMKEELEARKAMQEREFLRQVLSEVHEGSAKFNGNSDEATPQDAGSEVEDSADTHDEHEDNIEASIRRMSELNKHRSSERDRERQLGVQEGVRQDGKAKCAAADEAGARRLAKEAEANVRRKEEEQRRAQRRRQRDELLAKVERERQQRHEQWNSGAWSITRAIERYKTIGTFFDKACFSGETFPLEFIDIPWPSLRHPSVYRAQDVDWQSTKEFFETLKPYVREQAYKTFLKQSLQRFHPDRWSSRNLFVAIVDVEERNEVETAVNTVSKALGALYAESRMI